MDISNLKMLELLDLKESIDARIWEINKEKEDEIRRKDSVKNKTKLSQLTPNDRIFCIQIYENAYTNNMEVRVEYQHINHSGRDKNNNGFNFNYGGFSSWFSNEESDKHYLLTTAFGKPKFWTLKPESWAKDLKKAKAFSMDEKKKQFEKELQKYEESLNKFDELKVNIHQEVNKIIEND